MVNFLGLFLKGVFVVEYDFCVDWELVGVLGEFIVVM